MVKDIAKSHGILMSGVMVRAWLAGHKGQTRRTRGLDKINEEPGVWEFMGFSDSVSYLHAGNSPRYAAFYKNGKAPDAEFIRLPYGYTGDALYFKETWKMWEEPEFGKDYLHFRADDAKVDPTWWTFDDWKAPNPKWLRKNIFQIGNPRCLCRGCALESMSRLRASA